MSPLEGQTALASQAADEVAALPCCAEHGLTASANILHRLCSPCSTSWTDPRACMG